MSSFDSYTKDPAVQLDANFRLNAASIRAADDKMQAVQSVLLNHVVLERGGIAFTAGNTITKGQVCCMGSDGRAVPAQLSSISAGNPILGIAVEGASAGGKVVIIDRGLLDHRITGLDPSASLPAIAILDVLTGKAAYATNDYCAPQEYLLGHVDADGILTLALQQSPKVGLGVFHTNYNQPTGTSVLMSFPLSDDTVFNFGLRVIGFDTAVEEYMNFENFYAYTRINGSAPINDATGTPQVNVIPTGWGVSVAANGNTIEVSTTCDETVRFIGTAFAHFQPLVHVVGGS